MSKKVKKTKKIKKVKKAKKKVKKTKKKLLLISSPVAPEQKFYIASEMADDSQIEAELAGKATEYYVYHFPQDGKEIWGLSVKGANESVRLLNRNPKSGCRIRINPNFLRIEREIIQNGQKGVEVAVYAENLINGDGAWGIKFESYLKPKRSGGNYTDKFALEKALSKAERNAKRKLIPEAIILEMMKKFMRDKSKVVELEAPKVGSLDEVKVAPPTVKTDENKTFEMIAKAVKETKETSELIALRERAKGSKLYSADFKKKVNDLIVNEIKRRAKN